jgi:cell division protease FtsH
MNLGKSPARFDERPDTGISFDDIAGIDEDFEEIVSFLKNQRYIRFWSKKYQKVLLVGPPGTGKTLAKAIASEAMCHSIVLLVQNS